MRKIKTVEKKINSLLEVDVYKKSRQLIYVDARSLFIYVLKDYFGMTYEEIAEYMYNKGWGTNNHTTIRYTHLMFDEVRSRRPEMEEFLSGILSKTDPLYYKKKLMNMIENIDDKKTVINIHNYARKKINKLARESEVPVC